MWQLANELQAQHDLLTHALHVVEEQATILGETLRGAGRAPTQSEVDAFAGTICGALGEVVVGEILKVNVGTERGFRRDGDGWPLPVYTAREALEMLRASLAYAERKLQDRELAIPRES